MGGNRLKPFPSRWIRFQGVRSPPCTPPASCLFRFLFFLGGGIVLFWFGLVVFRFETKKKCSTRKCRRRRSGDSSSVPTGHKKKRLKKTIEDRLSSVRFGARERERRTRNFFLSDSRVNQAEKRPVDIDVSRPSSFEYVPVIITGSK